MKQKICYFIHTEYHLLLSLNDIITHYADNEKYDIVLVLKRKTQSQRLKQNFNFESLPYQVLILDFEMDLNKLLNEEEKNNLNNLLSIQLDTFIFFQEQDPITLILIDNCKKNNCKVYLYQDGLKAYVMSSMKFSFGLVLNDIKQNIWIRKNGYSVLNHFSFINCKNYGFLKGIDKLFLTFPNAYQNWNNLPVEKIKPVFTPDYKFILKKVFRWTDDFLIEKDNVIFFMNQPTHDDGLFELNLLQKIQINHPDKKLYIKNHPLTPTNKIEQYQKLNNVTVINSKIPAELFISELNNSIVVSIASTSMFINNTACRFYWAHKITEKNNIKRLKKFSLINPTDHIIEAIQIADIK